MKTIATLLKVIQNRSHIALSLDAYSTYLIIYDKRNLTAITETADKLKTMHLFMF